MSRSSLSSYRIFLKDGTEIGRLLIPEWCRLDFQGRCYRIADANIDGCLVVELIDPTGGGGPNYRKLPIREASDLFEKDYLTCQFYRFAGNVARIADFVGLDRATLYRKMWALGIIKRKTEKKAIAA